MRILLNSTLKRRVTAEEFASRSRIIFELGKSLAERGHNVSMLATGDSSIPGVKIIPVIDQGWVDLPPVENNYIREIASLVKQSRMLLDLQNDYDIVHNHVYPDFFPHTIDKELTIPLVSTLHALYDESYMDQTLSLFSHSYFVSLSKAYANLYAKTKFYDVVYNGVDTKLYAFSEQKGDYLLWLGRLGKAKNKEGQYMDMKGARYAIQLARETNEKLVLCGVVEEREFYERDIAPYLNDKIQWVGDVSPKQSLPVEKVVSLMQGAKAFLMTVRQHEPFGLVMAESMSCGTPIIGFDRGSVEEVVDDGKTGYVVKPDDEVDGLKKALSQIDTINPKDCREWVEKHFSIEAMVRNYERMYQKLIAEFPNKG